LAAIPRSVWKRFTDTHRPFTREDRHGKTHCAAPHFDTDWRAVDFLSGQHPRLAGGVCHNRDSHFKIAVGLIIDSQKEPLSSARNVGMNLTDTYRDKQIERKVSF
jgi:hypothetical protein